MKKFLLVLFSILPILSYAEFVNVNCVGRNISTTAVVDSFPLWYHLGNSTFVLSQEETDNFGVAHQFYQQYLDDVKVEGCILSVHSVDGIVSSVNGDIMPSSSIPSAPQNVSLRKAKKIASQPATDEPELVVVHTTNNGRESFYKAYKIFTSDSVKYVDVNTGLVLKSISLRRDVTCIGKTEFSGTQSFECSISSSTGNYILRDAQRNIETFYANVPKYRAGIDNGSYFGCSSSNWSGYYLTSITLESFGSEWWKGFADNEPYPQVYIAIYDSNNNLLYKTDIKDFSLGCYSLPVTFHIGKMIRVPSGGGLTIKIWDYDTLSDDLGMTVNLGSNTLGDHPWGNSSSNVKGKMTITDWHPALDIHWGQAKVYDYYQTYFNRNSFDNNGTTLNCIMHNPTSKIKSEYDLQSEYFNAYASHGSKPANSFMVFGLGGDIYGDFYNYVVTLDIIAHEYTHLISAFRPMGDLEYKGESGALNESMSDIMAMNIVHHYQPSTFNWKLGEHFRNNRKALRDFANPRLGSTPQPSCYQGSRWIDPSSSSDHGGVHRNSGVSNHWYYLLCEGGSGYNDLGDAYSVQPIGMDTAEQIVFNTLLYYLPQQATFKQARTLTIQTAQQLYSSKPYVAQSVADAWDAVGVYDTSVARQQFGIMVNGIVEHTASKIVAQDAQGRDQYVVSDIYLQAGDMFTCLDVTNSTNWVIGNLDPYGSYQNFTVSTRGIECQVSGCYTIYLKLAYNDDVIYIEPGNNCEEPEFVLSEGKYIIVTNRDKEGDEGWYYMTSDLGTASNKRYQAVSTSDSYDSIPHSNLASKYVWELVKDGNTWKLKNGNNFSNWTSGNTANFSSTGMQLTINLLSDNVAYIHFFDGTNERYLSLNGTTGNNYFAYYRERTQVPYLYLIPYTELVVDEPEEQNCFQLPFAETFSSSIGSFTIENVALDGLSYVWAFASGYGMKASAYVSSVNHPTESWLISPCLELPEDATVNLTFDHVYRYTSTPTTDLTLLVSEDYESGAPSSATWIPVAIPTYSSGSNWTFVNAGNIDLSAYAGKNVTLAFRYKSSASAAATWEIKNVSVTSSSITTGVDEVLNQNNATKCIIAGHLFILRDGHKFTATGTMVE